MKIKKAGFTLIDLLVVVTILTLLGAILVGAIKSGASSRNAQPQPASGVEKVQANAAVKHLYVISAYSGQVIIQSTVHGGVGITEGGFGSTRTPKYLEWCDTSGAAHELYVSDRIVIHISSDPLVLKENSRGSETVPKLEVDK